MPNEAGMDDLLRRTFEASRVFTPAAPIDSQALFAGRTRQVSLVIDAVNQTGQHAIIFGERGVGKTSLANVLAPWLESLGQRVLAPRVNCDSADTFSSAWKKLLSRIQLPGQPHRAGFKAEGLSEFASRDRLKEEYSPDDVIRLALKWGRRLFWW
jgi:Cdc6-like AAA superfamily ATPase